MESIELRDFLERDIPAIADLADNHRVSEYLTSRFPYPYTRQDAEWWVRTGCRERGCFKAIALDGQCVGVISANFQNYEHKYSAEVGYWLGEQYWGRGIATRALEDLSALVLGGGGIVRLYARVFSPNGASIRVLEKCGYRLEGTLRKAAFKNGVFMDELLYARLRPENDQGG